MGSNYPPGVTGSEPEIVGEPEDEEQPAEGSVKQDDTTTDQYVPEDEA